MAHVKKGKTSLLANLKKGQFAVLKLAKSVTKIFEEKNICNQIFYSVFNYHIEVWGMFSCRLCSKVNKIITATVIKFSNLRPGQTDCQYLDRV